MIIVDSVMITIIIRAYEYYHDITLYNASPH